MPNFKFTDLMNSLEFTHKFKESGRMAIYFGTHDYEYNGGFHKAAPAYRPVSTDYPKLGVKRFCQQNISCKESLKFQDQTDKAS